ncbi:MAG: hypothetical protein JWO86_5906, partial [Myxococcaceae bacterium]|nr:hypothetical protein [Myxococcaceae bacterium]
MRDSAGRLGTRRTGVRKTRLQIGHLERNSSGGRPTGCFMKSFSNLPAADVAALNPPGGAATSFVMTSIVKASRRAPLFALVVGLAVAGCSSSTGSSGTGGPSGTSGSAQCKMGTEAPYANPAGTPMAFPAGVAVEGEIGGDLSGDTKAHCKNAEDVEYASDLILACVGLRNSTASDVVVTFPAGLTFVAKTQATTNGILLHSHDVTVPAGVTYFAFRPASLNQACNPGSAADVYTLGNVTNDAKLLEVLALAKTKKVNGDIGA